MSSKLFKVVFAGAVTVGALLLPVTAAQASVKHHPCDRGGFGDNAFFGDGLGGFHDHGIGFRDNGFGFSDGDWGFGDHHRRHDAPTVIVVTVDKHHTKKHHHTKPAPTGNAADAGYGQAAPATVADAGYHKKHKAA